MGWIFKPVILVYYYFRSRPNIKINFESINATPIGEGSSTYHFLWDFKLVIHNDSNYLARGIKQLRKVPEGWALMGDFPTRLEPDQVIKLPLRASWHEEQNKLVIRYGTSSQINMLPQVQSHVFSQFRISISFINQYGRQYEQEFTWQDGDISSVPPKRAK